MSIRSQVLALGALMLGLAAGSSSSAQEPWRTVPDPPATLPTLSVPEAGGRTRLVAEGPRLVRVGGPKAPQRPSAELAFTNRANADGTGAGSLRELAVDPAGLTWVAAEHGLYLAAVGIDVLDRIDLGPGAPTGAPVSVAVDRASDGRRRVWLATEESFGVIDPSFFWGRTFTATDGLPGPGPYRIEGLTDGGLTLGTGSGTFDYSTSTGEPPRITGLELDGTGRERGARVQLHHGERPALGASGTALGGATFRYRIDDHHVWRALEADTRLPKLRPGTFRLQVIAIDRELERSEPFELTLQVDYPFYAAKSFAATVLGGGSLLALGVALLLARRRGGGLPRYALAALSAGLFVVLALQLLAGVVPHARGWPFIGFAMYTETHHEGEIIYDAGMIAWKQNGQTLKIHEGDLGVTTDGRWQVLRPLIDGGPEAGREAVGKLNQRWPQGKFDGISVRARRIRLTAEGPTEVAPIVLSHYREETDRGE